MCSQKVGNLKVMPSPDTDKLICNFFNETISDDKSIITAMLGLKNYSEETYYHSLRVAMYAVYMANTLSVDRLLLTDLVKGALVHDIGKLKVSYALLNYKGLYNLEQKKEIKLHPLYGIEYLKEHNFDITPNIRDIVLQHHEYCDGTGYPYGLGMKDLNEFSQIVTICDVFEAYTSRRIYHPNRSLKEGFDYLLYLSCNKKVNDKFTKAFIDNMI